MHYFLIIQPLTFKLKNNVFKTGSKMDLLSQQNAAKIVKRDTIPLYKNGKNALAGPKDNHMAKNEMGIGKYSLRYHTHQFKALCKKNDKRNTVEL